MNNSMPDQNTTIQTVTDVLDDVPMHLVTCLYCGGSWLYAGANLAREQAASHQCDVERAAFRRRKDDLLARLFPTGDES